MDVTFSPIILADQLGLLHHFPGKAFASNLDHSDRVTVKIKKQR